jgi:hypothetical protein
MQPGLSEHTGIIGTRQLIAVQTIDIARLTAQPVGLIPETFIAVTGRGPTDSNESGKTSFLSAVSLLLGDPEWRVTGTGAASVAALLFEPITAGAAIGVNAATEGFLVGVFADPDNAQTTSYTVWMKVSSGRPHLQVRHAAGVHLARGVDSAEIGLAAPPIYKSLGGEPLGSTEYARILYGRSPRVLAYVASRGQVRSRPSLLKLDAGTFAPEQIGDALIALTGRATLSRRNRLSSKNTSDAMLNTLHERLGYSIRFRVETSCVVNSRSPTTSGKSAEQEPHSMPTPEPSRQQPSSNDQYLLARNSPIRLSPWRRLARL